MNVKLKLEMKMKNVHRQVVMQKWGAKKIICKLFNLILHLWIYEQYERWSELGYSIPEHRDTHQALQNIIRIEVVFKNWGT